MAAYPQFCSTCGAPLPGPVPTCPRCRASVAPAAKRSAATVILIVIAVGFVGLTCTGILAAIAIPNFIRYQLRAKAAEVRAEVSALARAEQGQAAREGGRYVALPRTPAAPPSEKKEALSPAELQRAASLDWIAPPAAYGRYAVAVSEDGGAAAICGESDLDADGQLAVTVAFLPDRSGAAPAAPCTVPVPYTPEFTAGEVAQVSERYVF